MVVTWWIVAFLPSVYLFKQYVATIIVLTFNLVGTAMALMEES